MGVLSVLKVIIPLSSQFSVLSLHFSVLSWHFSVLSWHFSVLSWQEALCQRLELLLALRGVDGRVNAVVATEHTVDIAVDDGSRQSEGDAPDGRSGVVAHTFQLPDFIESIRKMAEGDDLLGGVVQVAGATVVAQPLPLTEHLVLRGGSKVSDRRPATHEALPILPALLHLRLLEDDLREPDGVRVLRPTPRQLPSVLTEPAEEGRGEGRGGYRAHGAYGTYWTHRTYRSYRTYSFP